MRLFCNCGRRKRYAVAVIGISDGRQLPKKVYGPFVTKSAAESFRTQWTLTWKGVAVLDTVYLDAVDKTDAVR